MIVMITFVLSCEWCGDIGPLSCYAVALICFVQIPDRVLLRSSSPSLNLASLLAAASAAFH